MVVSSADLRRLNTVSSEERETSDSNEDISGEDDVGEDVFEVAAVLPV